MKNLKRALALLVVVTMMISTVAFASFSDVTGSTNVTNAVNVGVGLNLFKGYEDGTFKPEGDITRAEFAAIVVRALGQEAQANGAKGKTAFTDVIVDDKDWASGYINIVTRLGIVNGYGDGNFGPEDKVTYEQAIKMIVVALGYTPAIGSAGYPVGYLTKAGELGITSGVAGSNGVPANRGTVAQLIFNALDVPLMTQDGYGTDISFIVNDGYGDTTRKTLMSENLDVVKLQVTVDSAEVTTSTAKNANDVVVTILNNYKTKYGSDFVQKGTVSGNVTFDGVKKLDAGKSGIADLVGAQAIAYVAYDSNSSDTPVVVFAVRDTSKTDELTVVSDDRDVATAAVAAVAANPAANPPVLEVKAKPITFAYWANETDRQTTKVTLASDTKLFVNGVEENVSNLVSKLNSFYGSVVFSKYGTATEDYNRAFITHYTNYVVDSVNTRTFKVSSKNSGSISFDPEDTTISSTLYDSKGVEMKWTDLKEWDVVSAKVVRGTSKTVIVGTLVTDKVTGKITELEPGDTLAKNKFTIDGKQYSIDANIAGKLAVDNEGIFYLDIVGRICYYDKTATLNSNYAYVVAAAPTTGIDNRTDLKLYTAKGEFVTLTTAQKVKVDGISNITSSELAKVDFVAADPNATPAVVGVPENATVAVGPFAAGVSTDADLTNYNAAKARYEDEGIGTKTLSGLNNSVVTYSAVTTIPEVVAGQFITYDTNSAGTEITVIDRANGTRLTETGIDGIFAQYGTATAVSSTYSSSSTSLTTGNNTSKVYLTDKTVVMIAYGTDEEKYDLVKVASIADDQIFGNVTFYNVNENREAGAVLINGSVTLDSATTGIAAITSSASSSTNAAGDPIYKFNALQGGVATTLIGSTNFTGTLPVVGYAVIPVLNAKGEVTTFNTALAVPAIGTDTMTWNVPANTTTVDGVTTINKSIYTYGLVTERKTNNLTVISGRGTDIAVPAGLPVYVFDERASSTNRVSIGDITDFDAKLATATDVANGYASSVGATYYDGTGDKISNVYAIAREYDGKIVDVMIYIFK